MEGEWEGVVRGEEGNRSILVPVLLSGFMQTLQYLFPGLVKTKFQGFPGLKKTRFQGLSRIHSLLKHGLHEVKKVHIPNQLSV